MISLAGNLQVQNVMKKGLRGDHLVQLRCVSKSQHVNNIDYFMKNESPERLSEIKSNKTIRNQSTVMCSGSTTGPKAKSQQFMSHFQDIVRELIKKADKYDSFGTGKHLERVFQYNVTGGKYNRGMTVVQAYELMAPKSSLTEANVKLSMYLGWCIEILLSFMFMIDDIMDESLTRRGKPCWYKVEDIGLSSINDALMLESGIYQILKDHFSHLDCYAKLLELFYEVSFATHIGQHMDIKTRYEDVLSFTMEKFKSLAINKTFSNTFYIPVAAAMYLAENADQESLRQANSILLEMSLLFNIRDDFHDCFDEVPNTLGSDIQNNSCTWLAVKCLERANAAQKAIMKENYGKNDEECIRRVKQLYEELSLPEVYRIYEKETLNMLRMKIQEGPQGIPINLYMKFLTKLQKQEL